MNTNLEKYFTKIIKLLLITALLGSLLLTCFACTPAIDEGNKDDDGDTTDTPTEPLEPEEPFVYKYVVVLGADGAGAFSKIQSLPILTKYLPTTRIRTKC